MQNKIFKSILTSAFLFSSMTFAQNSAVNANKANKIIEYETDEIIYQSPIIQSKKEKTFEFSIADSTKPFYTQIFAEHNNKVTAELIAPDGSKHEVLVANDGLSRLVKKQDSVVGKWQLNVKGELRYKVVISRAVGNIEVFGKIISDELAPNETTSVSTYLYDKRDYNVMQPTPIVYSQLTFEALVVYADGTSETLELFDDGKHQDAAAGDGFYANNNLKAKEQGVIDVYFTAKRANGWQLQTYKPEKIIVLRKNQSKITENYQDKVEDIDNDGFNDQLSIDVEVDFVDAGNYLLSYILEDRQGKEVTRGSTSAVIDSPEKKMLKLKIYGTRLYTEKHQGPYKVSTLYLEKEIENNLKIIDSKTNAYTTKISDYKIFIDKSIEFIGIDKVRGIDADKNGKFEALEVDYKLVVYKSGDYRTQASVSNNNLVNAEFIKVKANWTEGEQLITYRFDGEKIANANFDKLYLSNVGIFGPVSKKAPKSYLITDIDGSQFE